MRRLLMAEFPSWKGRVAGLFLKIHIAFVLSTPSPEKKIIFSLKNLAKILSMRIYGSYRYMIGCKGENDEFRRN